MYALKWIDAGLGACCLAVYVAGRPDPSQFELAVGLTGVLCLLAGAILHITEDA